MLSCDLPGVSVHVHEVVLFTVIIEQIWRFSSVVRTLLFQEQVAAWQTGEGGRHLTGSDKLPGFGLTETLVQIQHSPESFLFCLSAVRYTSAIALTVSTPSIAVYGPMFPLFTTCLHISTAYNKLERLRAREERPRNVDAERVFDKRRSKFSHGLARRHPPLPADRSLGREHLFSRCVLYYGQNRSCRIATPSEQKLTAGAARLVASRAVSVSKHNVATRLTPSITLARKALSCMLFAKTPDINDI